jgi:selenocysteine lyase/cysteine desulfurase
VQIPEDADGHIDLAALERHLVAYADRPLRIGSFSAASNVTGILSDTDRITTLLHEHGALSFWDFAAAAPYVPISMGSPARGPAYMDAVFLSPHKFVGGPGTPGVLAVRRELVTNRVPTAPGGGTVAYVGPVAHEYVADVVQREEGGTPDIVGSIRAGLVFGLKEAVGRELIRAREERFWRRAYDSWSANPRIEILGNHRAERLSIVSFVVRPDGYPGRYLHHNFVVSVLNDLFGVQARGGCSCAGPYGHRLLGIDLERSQAFQRQIHLGCEGIKPGWTRVNFNYFISDAVCDYVIDAVHLVADEGHKLLPDYRFEPMTGLWHHRAGPVDPPLSLRDVRYDDGGAMTWPRRRRVADEDALADQLADARRILAAAPGADCDDGALSPQLEDLRWFALPAGCLS